MTTVNGDPFAALNTGTTGAATTAKKADTLGQADFMRLMTEQLANQDPLKPLSNSEFVAQLAQFSTVQGISDLNTTVNGFTASLTGDQVLKGASLVGHSVVVPSESLALPASGNATGLVMSPGARIGLRAEEDERGRRAIRMDVKEGTVRIATPPQWQLLVES